MDLLTGANSMQRITTNILCSLSIWLALCTFTTTLTAYDWPQGLGPDRNGISRDTQSLKAWPESGPATAWRHRIGSGYSGPVVSGSKVIIFHRVSDMERVEALDSTSGKVLWKRDFKAFYRGGYNSDLGPRSTPVVSGGQIYVFGAAGDLHCLKLTTGESVWDRTLGQDYQAPDGYFGAGSSPLVIDGHVLVNVGGREAGIVAVDTNTGKTVWQATQEKASYSSPTVLHHGETQYALFITRMKALAVNPTNGKLLFSTPFGKQGPTVNGATPLAFDNRVFLTASYQIGAQMLELASPLNPAQPLKVHWSGDDILSSQYTTPILHDKHLFGTHGREDIGSAALRCVATASGKVNWEKPNFGVAHAILVKDRFLTLNTSGQLVLIQANTEKYEELARANVSPGTTRSFPALANGQFYFRSNEGDGGTLTALKLP